MENTLLPFSNKVKTIILVPVRGELNNGNLSHFLQLHEMQQGLRDEKLGIIFLVNDNATDKTNLSLQQENHQTYLLLADLAKKKDTSLLEIRVDFVHTETPEAHKGKLRLHLLTLANQLRNPEILPENIIIHFTDSDTLIPTSHYQTVKRMLTKGHAFESNIATHDFFPGITEGDDTKKIGKDALLFFDDYRLFHLRQQTQLFIRRRMVSGTPTLSAKMSLFLIPDGKALKPSLQNLTDYHQDEDYFLGTYLMNQRSGLPLAKRGVGNAGEVYFLFRTRPPKSQSMFDAELAYTKINKKDFTVTDDEEYDILTEAGRETYLTGIETLFGLLNRTPDFLTKRTYKKLLQEERQKEHKKVMMRKQVLLSYLVSVKEKRAMNTFEQKAIIPYQRYFPEIFAEIKRHIDLKESVENIADAYFGDERFVDFFNPSTQLHETIVRVRALMRYARLYGTETRDFIYPNHQAENRLLS